MKCKGKPQTTQAALAVRAGVVPEIIRSDRDPWPPNRHGVQGHAGRGEKLGETQSVGERSRATFGAARKAPWGARYLRKTLTFILRHDKLALA